MFDGKRTVSDISKAAAGLGWRPNQHLVSMALLAEVSAARGRKAPFQRRSPMGV
jgi:hypothetical protein